MKNIPTGSARIKHNSGVMSLVILNLNSKTKEVGMKDYDLDFNYLLKLLFSHINENGDDVIASLERVSQDGFTFPETITPEEERYAKAIMKWLLEVGPKNKRTVSRIALLLMSYIFYEDFHYPQPEKGIYDIANNDFEKLKWVYRYWFNQLEVAEKGSGIEDIFSSQDLSELAQKKPDNATVLSISCAGDLLAVDVLTPENTAYLFDEIRDFYSTTKIVSANLESTVDKNSDVGRTQVPGEPAKMNTSQEMFDKFRSEAGINFFSTATNHALDWDESGVLATLDVLAASGARYSGTAKSSEQQNDITVVNVWPESAPGTEDEELPPEMRVGLLSFTMDLNGFTKPEGKSYLVNEVRFNDVDPAPDYTLIKAQVAAAKEKGADWIIAYVHWGWEFEMYPHANIREVAHKIIECGVDTILGNHAHVSQPAELIKREGKQDALVIYSFGDFVSYHPESRNSKLSYIVRFEVVKKSDKFFIAGLDALPIYIINERVNDEKFNCRIVKFQNVLSNPDIYGLTDIEKNQLPHLRDKVWRQILSPLANLGGIN
ncbi:CapA family protein [Enterobacter kobei]